MSKIHYVYRLTYLGDDKVQKYYVGKRSANFVDVGIKYFTSSSVVEPIFKANPQKFKIKCVRIFKKCEDALQFERKYLKRVSAATNPLFFNECNSGSNGRPDRTNLVRVYDNEIKDFITVDVDTYKNNKNRYTSDIAGHVMVKDKFGNTLEITMDEFKNSNGQYMGVNKNVVHVTVKATGERITISKEEYQRNKDLYSFSLKGVSVYDTLLKVKTVIDKKDFDGVRYVGIKKFTGEGHKECPCCKRSISLSNFDRHLERHRKSKIYITKNDNSNTYRTTEYLYYMKYINDYHEVEKNIHGGVAYLNGEPKNIRYVSRYCSDLE